MSIKRTWYSWLHIARAITWNSVHSDGYLAWWNKYLYHIKYAHSKFCIVLCRGRSSDNKIIIYWIRKHFISVYLFLHFWNKREREREGKTRKAHRNNRHYLLDLRRLLSANHNASLHLAFVSHSNWNSPNKSWPAKNSISFTSRAGFKLAGARSIINSNEFIFNNGKWFSDNFMFFFSDFAFIFKLEVVIFGNFFTKYKQAMRWPTE